MDIVGGKAKAGRKQQKRGRSIQEEKFNRAWQRVQNQQRKNAGFMDQVERFAQKVEQQIGDRERQYADMLYLSCEHLIGFYARKSLALWQRETLLDWMMEYLMALTGSPFSDHLDINGLQEKCTAAMDAMHPPQRTKGPKEAAEEPASGEPRSRQETQGQQTEDMFEDLFAEHAFENDADDDPFSFEEEFGEDGPFKDYFREQQEYEEAQKQKARSLKQLVKNSSVNKLFRKLARVLHPDLEQDQSARENKNRLMGELIEARNNNDISMIFSLYAEHVGESPLTELNDDLGTVTLLLQEHYEYLRDHEQELLVKNPRSGVIYERFYHKNPRGVQRNIDRHLSKLKQLITNQKLLIKQVTSLNKLKPLLEERHSMNMLADVFDEFESMYN